MKKLLLTSVMCAFAFSANAQESKKEMQCRNVATKICVENIRYKCDLKTACYSQLKSECEKYWSVIPLDGLDCNFLIDLEEK